MRAQLITPSTVSVLTLQEVKDHLRVDAEQDDPVLTSLLVAAEDYVEKALDRALMQKTYRLDCPHFFPCVGLPWSPLSEVESIEYYDSSNDLQTLDDAVYDVDFTVEPAQIRLAYQQSWPTTYCRPDAVQITYVVGYETTAEVPQLQKQAVLLLIGAWFENREALSTGGPKEVPLAFDAIIQSCRVYRW
jgi:uncharacterized phiE125 gp8 family phage protein